MTGNLFLKSDARMNFAIFNEDGNARMWLYKDKDGDGIRINNGIDGGGEFVLGKDDILYVPLAVRAGGSKRLSVQSGNSSALSAIFNLWGDANRPTVVELDDDQGWHLFSQRNPDGSILFTVNGEIKANTLLHAGDATVATDGNVNGSVWGGWLNNWLNSAFASRDNNINSRATWDYINQNFITRVMRGSPVNPGKVNEYGPAEAPAGCVVTSVRHDPTTAYGIYFTYRPLNVFINGGWRVIEG
ncbi:TPA: hypothetical protein G9F26_004644 [Salmonella enterica]|uniref:Bacteriophage T7 Gp17 C-terminal domain-containing protein n=1 Tax=Salmonella enterica TaxID=28901 RepID=A0A750MRW0_SALER|nr:hypothetical protein [Salmonella enterica]